MLDCVAAVRAGQHPVLLVPDEEKDGAKAVARYEGVGDALTVFSIEEFLAKQIIDLAIQDGKDHLSVLREIVDVYNSRLAQVETDLSLSIELR